MNLISSLWTITVFYKADSCWSYLRIVGSLEVGQQQADEHRALLLVAHKSADPNKTLHIQKSVRWGKGKCVQKTHQQKNLNMNYAVCFY